VVESASSDAEPQKFKLEWTARFSGHEIAPDAPWIAMWVRGVLSQATVTIVTSGRDPASVCAEIESMLQLWRSIEADRLGSEAPSLF
jgi:hypothetical protein